MKLVNENGVVTIVSDVTAAQFKEAPSAGAITDEKGKLLYQAKVEIGAAPELSKYGCVFNAVVDGKLAVMFAQAPDADANKVEEMIKKNCKVGIINFTKYTPQIAADAAHFNSEVATALAALGVGNDDAAIIGNTNSNPA